ncbi:hypothetical protein CRG98_019505 [Punica granatum]|uniref:DUF7745 domain-containing protein n=1 Tax=Punica granatum TaxID=22663 RepID=A0A2I0JUU7_PUNGR|nr:hypothetical protein CRG98_019505 [Punica granatum]
MASGDSFSRTSRLVSCPRLDRVTPPLEEITRIWRALRPVDRRYISAFVGDIPLLATRHVDWNFLEAAIAFWNPSCAVFDIQGTELTPTIEEYRTLIGQTVVVHGIVEPNFHTARPTLVSRLLGVPTTRLNAELAYSDSTKIAIEKLIFFIESRAHRVQGDFLRKDLCHTVLLLIFGTLLFPHLHSLIDAALASVVFQVVGGRGYEVALVAETIRLQKNTSFASTDGVQQHTKISSTLRESKMAGHPAQLLLRIWPSKPSSLISEPKEIVFIKKSQRRTSSLLISTNYRESSPRPVLSYRGAIRNWHEQTPLWRSPRKGLVGVHIHPRIDTSARPSN